MLKLLYIALFISTFSTSCGLIEKFKTPTQPTESKDVVAEIKNEEPKTEAVTESNADDLFTNSMNENKTAENPGTDAPSNITTEVKTDSQNVTSNDELKSLQDEFSGTTANQNQIKEAQPTKVKVEEALPEIKAEIADTNSQADNPDAGEIKTYKVKKGETLMIIAFNLYGDVSKWKELKQINGNSELRANMELKYKAPAKSFVWNPSGTPYMIKNGDTLGIISNSLYQTPKKWKSIWENNKPLIKDPNVIYAGFTLYYKNDGLANYVQPKNLQKKIATKPIKKNQAIGADSSSLDIEEVKVEKALSELDKVQKNEIDLTKETQSSTLRATTSELNENLKEDSKIENSLDEAIVK